MIQLKLLIYRDYNNRVEHNPCKKKNIRLGLGTTSHVNPAEKPKKWYENLPYKDFPIYSNIHYYSLKIIASNLAMRIPIFLVFYLLKITVPFYNIRDINHIGPLIFIF